MPSVLPWLLSASMMLGPAEPTEVDSSGAGEPPAEEAPEPSEARPSAAVRAQRHFQAEEWDEAVEALMEAYAADPDPAYLYARAQAERMRGRCSVAVALYRRFLETGPTELQRVDTERHIRLCEEILFTEGAEAEPEPETSVAPAPSPSPVERSRPVDEPRPWSRDPLGWSLVSVGGGATVAGAVVWGLGQRDLRRAPMSSTEGDYEQGSSTGRQRMVIGASVAGVGLALAVGGIVRLALLARASGPFHTRRGAPRMGLRWAGGLILM